MKRLSLYDKLPSSLCNQRGMSLMIVLVMLVVLGLSMGVAGSTWKSLKQRANEEELLFRGDQYRRAIESYSKTQHGGATGMLPSKLEDLVKDPRSASGRRHIRRLFLDPMTGESFAVIKDPRFGGRIKGVYSTSRDNPYKTDGFAEEYETFAQAESYQDWRFVFEPKAPRGNKKTPLGREEAEAQTGEQETPHNEPESTPQEGN